MGVGTIGIVDGDTVDVSNLQRQVIHSEADVGEMKCRSAAQTCRGINGNVKVLEYPQELTPKTGPEIFSDHPWSLCIDGSDNFPTKYLISDLCELHSVPFVYSAISAFEGQVCVFNSPPGVGPTFRDYLPVPPDPGEIPSCAEGGVLGVVPGVMGAMQVVEGVKTLVNGAVDKGVKGVRMGKKGEEGKAEIKIWDALEGAIRKVTVEREGRVGEQGGEGEQ